MADIINTKTTILNGKPVPAGKPVQGGENFDREKTMAYKILRRHSVSGENGLRIKFDALISHDITYVGIIQTARASGLKEFPVPYALTNCHNSLCAVGGTINEDDHAFGLSAAKKYGGIYVPANHAVIHQFAREKLAKCGEMILGSDSHTRYGFLGCMGIGEGGGELAKQLLGDTYDITEPEVILVWLTGTPRRGVGPHDVALELVAAAFPDGFAKNKVLEFAGPGVHNLSMDFRAGIDVMTTETSCLSSIWITDDKTRQYYENIGRAGDFSELSTEDSALYDSLITIDLEKTECMIALPFHPSKAVSIHQLQKDYARIFAETQEECNRELGGGAKLDLLSVAHENGNIHAEQGVIVGCAGGMYENISEAADILRRGNIGSGYFDLSVYPSSSPVSLALLRDGIAGKLSELGAVVKPAFCGPCFGAGDTPANATLSIRHATRNFASREGSRPQDGQIASVALMDARSIAATAANGGILTAATDIEYTVTPRQFVYSDAPYSKRVYYGYGKADREAKLRFGPNIADWPEMPPLKENLLMQIAAIIHDDVTTTDELIPSGETSSYRSNPVRLAQFALSRRYPKYVRNAKNAAQILEHEFRNAPKESEINIDDCSLGSVIYAKKPGDGSAREQAASCQKILGGFANIAKEYATKRYRSNCVNWGIIPFTTDDSFNFNDGDFVYIKDVRKKLLAGEESFDALVISGGRDYPITLRTGFLSDEERRILAAGCLMNRYKERNSAKN